MADEKGFIKPEEYRSEWQDFYRPIKIQAAPDPVASAPASNLAAQSGIKVSVEKPDIDVNINKISDPKFNTGLGGYYNVLSAQTFNPQGITTYNKYEDMIKKVNPDKVGPLSKESITSFAMPTMSDVLGLAARGDYGFGKRLEGPTGKGVFSVGKLSEMALENHYSNFVQSKTKYDAMNTDIADGKFNSAKTWHRTNDAGFFAVIGNNHFSRKPGGSRFEGHLGHLHSDEHTAFNMLKSMDAMSKGLDPRGGGPLTGYDLKGDNAKNLGMSDAMLSNGMGGISNDGYYTYVSGADLGHTKSKLYGGNLSEQLASELRKKGYSIDNHQLIAVMAQARKGDKTFQELLNAYKTNQGYYGAILQGQGSGTNTSTIAGINKVSGFTSNINRVGDNWQESGNTFGKDTSQIKDWENTLVGTAGSKYPWKRQTDKSSVTSPDTGMVNTSLLQSAVKRGEIVSSLPAFKKAVQEQYSGGGRDLAAEEAAKEEAEKNRAKAQLEKQVERSKTTYGGRWVGGLASGGQVSGPVGQLASMLRSNRLGYNQGGAVQSGYYGYQEGGQINMQEMGFVNGKTPDQVTDAQSVADTEAMSADEGDFVINAPAVEAVGVEAIIGLVSDALTLATEEGVEIVDIPQDTSPEVMVDILVSEGEFIVPRELIPFIDGGLETLEKINALGTDEVSQRVDETAMMEQMGDLEAPPQETLPQEIPPQQDSYVEGEQMPAFQKGGTVLPYDLGYLR